MLFDICQSIFLFYATVSFVSCVNYEWMYYEPYGKTVTLRPIKQNKTLQWFIRDCKWTTPDNIELVPEQVNRNSQRYYIEKSTCELTITNIQKDTNGIYHCTVNNLNISKAMLNYHGPPPKDFLDEYKWNLVAGFSTAGGIMAFFIFAWAVHKFRYREDSETKPGAQEVKEEKKNNAQYVSSNSSYDPDLDERIDENQISVDCSVQRF